MYAFEKMELTEEVINDITKYEKSFGKNWVDKSIQWNKVKCYVDTYLSRIEKESSTRKPWNCYVEGTDVYTRVDNLPITQDDLDALNHYSSGQGLKIIGNVGDMKARREWFCDSSG